MSKKGSVYFALDRIIHINLSHEWRTMKMYKIIHLCCLPRDTNCYIAHVSFQPKQHWRWNFAIKALKLGTGPTHFLLWKIPISSWIKKKSPSLSLNFIVAFHSIMSLSCSEQKCNLQQVQAFFCNLFDRIRNNRKTFIKSALSLWLFVSYDYMNIVLRCLLTKLKRLKAFQGRELMRMQSLYWKSENFFDFFFFPIKKSKNSFMSPKIWSSNKQVEEIAS